MRGQEDTLTQTNDVSDIENWEPFNHDGQHTLDFGSPGTVRGMASILGDGEKNMKNYITITLAIMSVVLPPIKRYVQDKMKCHFILVKSVEEKQIPPKTLTSDPYKATTKFGNLDYLRDQTQFWKTYIDTEVYKEKFKDLNDCYDINVFFLIMSKAGCFDEKEAKLASKAQHIRNLWAHPSIHLLTNKYTKIILSKLETVIKILPESLKEEPMKKLEELRKHGCINYLQHAHPNSEKMTKLENVKQAGKPPQKKTPWWRKKKKMKQTKCNPEESGTP